jgi:hypothetical protein
MASAVAALQANGNVEIEEADLSINHTLIFTIICKS